MDPLVFFVWLRISLAPSRDDLRPRPRWSFAGTAARPFECQHTGRAEAIADTYQEPLYSCAPN